MDKPQPPFIFPLVLGAFSSLSYAIFVVVYTVQPTPFIDEVFHVPQAQKYCLGNFQEWDPKITTLPGLYLFTIGLNGPVSWVLGRDLCDLFCLRVTNLVATAVLLSALHKLLLMLHGRKHSAWKISLAAVNLALLPVLYWFSFLYYTDVVATLVAVLCLLFHHHQAPGTAAALGVVAVVMRQTNVIWVLFLLGLSAGDALGTYVLKGPVHSLQDLKTALKKLKKTSSKPYKLAEIVADIFSDCSHYLLVILAFLAFVTYNGGIVVGDKSAHEATIHLPQIGYFCFFFLLFSLPQAPLHVKPFVKLCQKNAVLVALILVFGVMAVHSNTLEHPYLLSDNRHYVFYLWNRLYGRYSFFRYIMVPLYLFGGYMIHSSIQHRSIVFKIAFYLCLSASIVPQKLLEFRYFIIPFLVARSQSVAPTWLQLATETLYYLLINAVTLYVFVSKTFMWEDLTEPQRIMW